MGFELPAAYELRNGAVENEGVENIDVIDHEEGGAVRIETGRAADFYPSSGEKGDTAAESSLEPVVLAHIEKNIEKDEKRRGDEKVDKACDPKRGTANGEIGALHMCTSTAPGMTSRERISRWAI